MSNSLFFALMLMKNIGIPRNSSRFRGEHQNLLHFAELLTISWNSTPRKTEELFKRGGSLPYVSQSLNLARPPAGTTEAPFCSTRHQILRRFFQAAGRRGVPALDGGQPPPQRPRRPRGVPDLLPPGDRHGAALEANEMIF